MSNWVFSALVAPLVGSLITMSFTLFSFSADAFPPAPNQKETTGVLCSETDSDFKEFRYNERIPYCRRDVASHLKKAIYESYRIPDECRDRFTIDHFYPLALGGNNHRMNLWPEHKFVKGLRHNLENELYHMLKDGKITRSESLARIRAAKLSPPVQEIPESTNPCDQVEFIESINESQAQETTFLF